MPAISVQKPAAADCEPETSLYQRESGHLKTTTKYYMAGEMTLQLAVLTALTADQGSRPSTHNCQ